MQGAEHEISGKVIVTAQKGFDRLIDNPKDAHADKQEKADQSGCDRGKKWTDEGSGKHGKTEDTRADQADSDSADQRKTDFAASVGKPGDKCIQGKGEGEKRGLGDYP